MPASRQIPTLLPYLQPQKLENPAQIQSSIMAAPPAKTIRDLNGKWIMVLPTSAPLHPTPLTAHRHRTNPSPTTSIPSSPSYLPPPTIPQSSFFPINHHTNPPSPANSKASPGSSAKPSATQPSPSRSTNTTPIPSPTLTSRKPLRGA